MAGIRSINFKKIVPLIIFCALPKQTHAEESYQIAIEKCEAAVREFETAGEGPNSLAPKVKCDSFCDLKIAKNNNWELGRFESYWRRCHKTVYDCGNKMLCRVAVMDLRVRCADNPQSCGTTREALAQQCQQACSSFQNEKCKIPDLKDYTIGQDICTAPPGRRLISDQEAAAIYRARAEDMARNNGVPTQPSSFRSVFYGTVPGPEISSNPRSSGASNPRPATAQDSVQGQVPESQGTPGSNGQQPAASTTAQNGEGGDSSAGGSSGGGMGGAGGGGASSGGGAFASSSASGNAASGSGNNGERVASNSASESTFGKDGGGGAESVGGSGGGNNSLGRSAGRINPSSSGGGDIGGAAGGRGGMPLLPSSAFTKTASNGRGSAPGTVGSDQFRTQFHGKNGGGAGGVGGSTQVASKDAAGKIKKKKKRPGAGDSLSAFLASMWGKKTSKNSGGGRSPASVQRTHNPEIGRGLHDVFRPVTTYFNQQPLEEDGSLSE